MAIKLSDICPFRWTIPSQTAAVTTGLGAAALLISAAIAPKIFTAYAVYMAALTVLSAITFVVLEKEAIYFAKNLIDLLLQFEAQNSEVVPKIIQVNHQIFERLIGGSDQFQSLLEQKKDGDARVSKYHLMSWEDKIGYLKQQKRTDFSLEENLELFKERLFHLYFVVNGPQVSPQNELVVQVLIHFVHDCDRHVDRRKGAVDLLNDFVKDRPGAQSSHSYCQFQMKERQEEVD